MKKNNIRDTPVIVIPKGYTIDDLMDFDDDGYENGEPAMVEEVKGNLVLNLAKTIKPELCERPKYGKLKPNDRRYKRRRAISRYNIQSLFGKFLRSFIDESELLERDFSHRLQDIEKGMEEQRKRENGEYKEVNYKD